MNLQSLETLVQILGVRSFSAVAEIRNMTLSAVSMQMKSLETELGVRLFDRQSRPPRLTPLGRQVAEQARALLSEKDNLMKLCQDGQSLTGHFLIGFIQTASVRILPGFLAKSHEKAPDASFQFSSGLSETLSEYVVEGRLDAAVVTRVDQPIERLCLQRIATEEMIMALPKAFADAADETIGRNLPFIRFRPTSGIGRLISSAPPHAQSKPEKELILDSIEGTIECVKRGLGYTVLPKPDVERYSDEHIVMRSVKDRYPNRDLVLATRHDKQSEMWRDQLFALMTSEM